MPYATYRYLYPPRPGRVPRVACPSPPAIPLREAAGYWAQIKFDGTCSINFIHAATGTVKLMTRHSVG